LLIRTGTESLDLGGGWEEYAETTFSLEEHLAAHDILNKIYSLFEYNRNISDYSELVSLGIALSSK
jgi:hypothetical protein